MNTLGVGILLAFVSDQEGVTICEPCDHILLLILLRNIPIDLLPSYSHSSHTFHPFFSLLLPRWDLTFPLIFFQ